MAGGGTPVASPYEFAAYDVNERAIRITVTFDNTTRALSGATLFRDPDCIYKKIYVGRGADGTPDNTLRKFTVPAGTTQVTQAQLNAVGLNTIEEFISYQITAGP